MSTIKKILKKTHILSAWRAYTKTRSGKKIRKWLDDRYYDRLYDHILPAAYNAHRKEAVNPRKVLFIERRYDHLTDSLQGLYEEMKRRGMEVHTAAINESCGSKEECERRNKEAVAEMATAKYVFISDANPVVSAVKKRPETLVIQVWHACGAFKKFGMSTMDRKFGLTRKEQMRHPVYGNLDYVMVSSEEIIWAYADAMGLTDRKEIIYPAGTSRTDAFFRQDFREKAYEHLYKAFPAARGKKVILFAPTFRGHIKDAETSKGPDLALFAEKLGADYVLVYKHHPLVKNLPDIPELYKNQFAFDATKEMSIEDLLCVSDLCISDYSSVIFEFSLFERPMLFFAYDLEEYDDWRGFYYPYEELTPGPVCRTSEEMIDYILHLDTRFDRTLVRDFRQKFMGACDGHATERICDLVMQEHRS